MSVCLYNECESKSTTQRCAWTTFSSVNEGNAKATMYVVKVTKRVAKLPLLCRQWWISKSGHLA